MWPTHGHQQPYYWHQWQQPQLYGNHPTPQETDPVEWAAKAAQWAQQRLMQDQYTQHMNQWQQQQPVIQQQQPVMQQQQQPVIQQQQQQQQQPVIQQQQQQQPVMPPPSHHQPTPELQQHVSPEVLHQAEQQNRMASHMQQDGTLVSASPQQQPSPAHFEEPSRGREDYHGGIFNEGRQYHPRDNFGMPRREFPPRGRESYQNDFRFRSPRPHGFERPPRPHGFAFEGGPMPPHRWEKEGFMGEQEGPRPPTESYFAGETSNRSNDPSGYPPSSTVQETLPKMDYSERESYEDNRFQREKMYAGGRDQGVELERFEREINESSTEQDEWLYGGRKQPVGQFETEAVQRRPQQPHLTENMDSDRSPRDQQQTPHTVPQDQSSFHQHNQEQPFYHQQSRETFSYHQQDQEKPPYNEVRKTTSATNNQATISSLSKSPAVIPGLGGYEERESPVPNSQGNRDSSHANRETESPQPQTTQVIESLGKIVSQLQTLQGLTSSLQLLQTLPKGQPEAMKTAGEGEKAREAAQREREVSEETKRKVAALLANDSDSEGEQSADVRPKETPKEHISTAQGSTNKDSSPPAREFDGTFDVKPQVYGTYPTQEQYPRQEGGFNTSSGYREGTSRFPEYDYPPQPQRPRDYVYGQPPRDYPYPSEYSRGAPIPGMKHESRDYGHERPPYDGKGYEGARYERDYPPPSELMGTSLPRAPPQQGYYDREVEKERPNITSQIESIDYSHGGGLPNVQTVDYHHGQPTQAEPGYADRQPRIPYYPPSHYDDYPAPPGYGPRPYPSYPGGFPPPPHHYPPYGGGSYIPPGLDPASIFAAYTGESKRKALPGWLKDALEKMERDKQKKMEKEAKELLGQDKDRSERPMWKDELELEEEERDKEKEETGGKPWVTRSYRYSHSKSPLKSDSEEDRSPPPHQKRRVEEPEDEEERQLTLIMRIRKMLTEILLEVTSQEIEDIVNEVVEEAKKPKLAFLMKGQQKPVTENVLGLGAYGSESESEGSGGGEEERKRTKSKSRAFGPALDPLAIAEAFRDSRSVDRDRQQEKEREATPKERKKSKDRSSKKESSSERRSSDEKSHESRSGTKDRDKDREKDSSRRSGKEKESTKVSSKYGSPSSSSRSKDHSTSSPSTTKQKSSRARSRSPAKSSDRRHSSSRESKTRSSKSDKKSASKQSPNKNTHKSRSPPSSPARKRPRHHSRSPSPARGGSKAARSRSRSPHRSAHSKSTKKSPPRFSSSSKRK